MRKMPHSPNEVWIASAMAYCVLERRTDYDKSFCKKKGKKGHYRFYVKDTRYIIVIPLVVCYNFNVVYRSKSETCWTVLIEFENLGSLRQRIWMVFLKLKHQATLFWNKSVKSSAWQKNQKFKEVDYYVMWDIWKKKVNKKNENKNFNADITINGGT